MKIDPKTQGVLENTALVHLRVTVWSGQAKLDPSDIRLGDGGKLPPADVAQIGHKKICDPKLLKTFTTQRERIRNVVTDVGVPLMGGYAVPVDAVPRIQPVIDKLIEEFEAAKEAFLASYDQALDNWIQEHPEFASAIRSSVLSAEQAGERISASYSIYQLAPVAGCETLLSGTDTSMSNALIEDIQREARKFYDRYGNDAVTKVDPRTSATWKNLRFKVGGLTFLDAKFDALYDLLQETIDLYAASSGSVTGLPLAQLKHNALVLSSDEIHRVLDGTKAADTDADSAPAEDAPEEVAPTVAPAVSSSPAETPAHAGPAKAPEDMSASTPDADPAPEAAQPRAAKASPNADFDELFGDLDALLSDDVTSETVADNARDDALEQSKAVPQPPSAERIASTMDWGAW